MEQDTADKKLSDTLDAVQKAELKLAEMVTRQQAATRELSRLEARHVNLKAYEKQAWDAMRKKDKELMDREANVSLAEGNAMAHIRSNLPAID